MHLEACFRKHYEWGDFTKIMKWLPNNFYLLKQVLKQNSSKCLKNINNKVCYLQTFIYICYVITVMIIVL